MRVPRARMPLVGLAALLCCLAVAAGGVAADTLWVSGTAGLWALGLSPDDAAARAAFSQDLTDAINVAGTSGAVVTVDSVVAVVPPTWADLTAEFGSSQTSSNPAMYQHQGVTVTYTLSGTSVAAADATARLLASSLPTVNTLLGQLPAAFQETVLPLPDPTSTATTQGPAVVLNEVVLSGPSFLWNQIILNAGPAVVDIVGVNVPLPDLMLLISTKDVQVGVNPLMGSGSLPSAVDPMLLATAIDCAVNNSGFVIYFTTYAFQTQSALSSDAVNASVFVSPFDSWNYFLTTLSGTSAMADFVSLFPTRLSPIRVLPTAPPDFVENPLFNDTVVQNIASDHVIVIGGDSSAWSTIVSSPRRSELVAALENDITEGLYRTLYTMTVTVSSVVTGSLHATVNVNQGVGHSARMPWSAMEVTSVLAHIDMAQTKALYPDPSADLATLATFDLNSLKSTRCPTVCVWMIVMGAIAAAIIVVAFIICLVYACVIGHSEATESPQEVNEGAPQAAGGPQERMGESCSSLASPTPKRGAVTPPAVAEAQLSNTTTTQQSPANPPVGLQKQPSQVGPQDGARPIAPL